MATTPISLRVKSSNAVARRELQSRSAVSFTSCSCSRSSRPAVPRGMLQGSTLSTSGSMGCASWQCFPHPATASRGPGASSHSWQNPHSWECSKAAVSKQRKSARQCHTSCNILHTPTLFLLQSRIKTQVLGCCFLSSIWMRLLQSNSSQEFYICSARTYRPFLMPKQNI